MKSKKGDASIMLKSGCRKKNAGNNTTPQMRTITNARPQEIRKTMRSAAMHQRLKIAIISISATPAVNACGFRKCSMRWTASGDIWLRCCMKDSKVSWPSFGKT